MLPSSSRLNSLSCFVVGSGAADIGASLWPFTGMRASKSTARAAHQRELPFRSRRTFGCLDAIRWSAAHLKFIAFALAQFFMLANLQTCRGRRYCHFVLISYHATLMELCGAQVYLALKRRYSRY